MKNTKNKFLFPILNIWLLYFFFWIFIQKKNNKLQGSLKYILLLVRLRNIKIQRKNFHFSNEFNHCLRMKRKNSFKNCLLWTWILLYACGICTMYIDTSCILYREQNLKKDTIFSLYKTIIISIPHTIKYFRIHKFLLIFYGAW